MIMGLKVEVSPPALGLPTTLVASFSSSIHNLLSLLHLELAPPDPIPGVQSLLSRFSKFN